MRNPCHRQYSDNASKCGVFDARAANRYQSSNSGRDLTMRKSVYGENPREAQEIPAG
jgi:hypothetical protein